MGWLLVVVVVLLSIFHFGAGRGSCENASATPVGTMIRPHTALHMSFAQIKVLSMGTIARVTVLVQSLVVAATSANLWCGSRLHVA
jgi:hypothetical protein